MAQRGRPKGSGGVKTLMEVTLSDLEKVAGPNTRIPIQRKWWVQMGGETTENEKVTPSPKEEEPKVSFFTEIN